MHSVILTYDGPSERAAVDHIIAGLQEGNADFVVLSDSAQPIKPKRTKRAKPIVDPVQSPVESVVELPVEEIVQSTKIKKTGWFSTLTNLFN